MAQHGPKLYDFRLVDSNDEIDPSKEASELRRIIRDEIAEDYSDLDMEAEYRNPIFYSPQEIASKNVPLRYVRRLLGRSDLEFLPLTVLRSLIESAGYLDKTIHPQDAQLMLRFCDPTQPGFMEAALKEADKHTVTGNAGEKRLDCSQPGGEQTERRSDTARTYGTAGAHAAGWEGDGSAQGLAPATGSTISPSRGSLPTVALSKLTEWHREWAAEPANQFATEKVTLDAARAHFSGKHISRDMIRQIRGPQKRGPKRFSG